MQVAMQSLSLDEQVAKAKPRVGFRARARKQFSNFLAKSSSDHKNHQLLNVETKEVPLIADPASREAASGNGSGAAVVGQNEWPEGFWCPISRDLMADPVMLGSGISYERRVIELYLKRGHNACYKTGEALEHQSLIKNSSLKDAILYWCDRNQVPRPVSPSYEIALEIVDVVCGKETRNSGPAVESNSSSRDTTGDASEIGSRDEESMEDSSGNIDGNDIKPRKSTKSAPRRGSYGKLDGLLEFRRHTWSDAHRDDTSEFFSSDASDSSGNGNSRCLTPSTAVGETGVKANAGSACVVPLPLRTTPSSYVLDDEMERPGATPAEGPLNEDLFRLLKQKLQQRQVAEQEEAAMQVKRLTRASAENRLALCDPEFLAALLPLVESRCLGVQVNALAAVVNLSLEMENKLKVVRAGAIPSLIEVLKSGKPAAQEHAAGAIFSLATDDGNRMAIGVMGAIPPLIQLLRSGQQRAQHDAAMALYHLSLKQTNGSKLIKAGAVSTLLGIAQEEKNELVSRALLILFNIAAMQEGRVALAEMNAVPVLVWLLRKSQTPEDCNLNRAEVQEHAAATLLQLAHHSYRLKAQALQAGAMESLQRLAEEGTWRAREKATALLTVLRDKQNQGSNPGLVYSRPYSRTRGEVDKAESAQF